MAAICGRFGAVWAEAAQWATTWAGDLCRLAATRRQHVAVSQGQEGIPITVDVGPSRLGVKLPGAFRKRLRSLSRLRQSFLHQLKRPSVLVIEVRPQASCHREA